MISLNEYQWPHEEKKLNYKNQDKILYAKTIKFLIYVNCPTKTVSSMIRKEFWIRTKIAKICNMLKLNQNWCLTL